jgi:hypothetical protein
MNKNMINIDSRQSQRSDSKTPTKSYSGSVHEVTINNLKSQNQELSDKIFELKNILTEHKTEIEKTAGVIKDYKSTLNDSNTNLKSMLSTYFIFLDFYKQIQTVPVTNSWASNYCQINAELEIILSKDWDRVSTIDFEFDKIQNQIDKNNEFLQLKDDKELQSFVEKYSVGDKDDLQVYNQEYDLSKELEFEGQKNSKVHQYRTSSQCSISHQDLKLVKENEYLQKQIRHLKDLKQKAKENRHTMYFRNDRKMIELKKVYYEKEKLSEKCSTLETQYHNLKMLNFDKSEELREDKVLYSTLMREFDSLKTSSEEEKHKAVLKAERLSEAKNVALEFDLKICKDKLKTSKC